MPSYPPSWLDDTTRISGGMMFGLMTENDNTPITSQTILSEGATKANRKNYLIHTFYNDINSVPVMSLENSVQTGSLLGHQAWPIIHPFGFGSTTIHWPVAGLAAFSNGSLDSILSSWCTTLNAQVGGTPYFIRPFREFNNQVTIYGPNGSSVGGVNETTTTFISAWQYVVTYIRARVPMARFIWCPDTTTTPTVSNGYYPGNSYVDWIGADAYMTSGNSFTLTNMQTWYAAFKPGGSLGYSKPIMTCETSVQAVDPARIADFATYTSLYNGMPLFSAVVFWDSASTGPYYVSDSPAGFLSTFQGVVGAAPFLGTASTAGNLYAVSQSKNATLSGSSVDIVNFPGLMHLVVLNRAARGGADMTISIDGTTPSAGGDNKLLVPAGSAIKVTASQVQLIGSSNPYSIYADGR